MTGRDRESLLKALRVGGYEGIGEEALAGVDGLTLMEYYQNRADRAMAVFAGKRGSDIAELQFEASGRWQEPAGEGFSSALEIVASLPSAGAHTAQPTGRGGTLVFYLFEHARNVLLDMDELSGEDVKWRLKIMQLHAISDSGTLPSHVYRLRSSLEEGCRITDVYPIDYPIDRTKGPGPPVPDPRLRAKQVCFGTAYALLAIAVVIDGETSLPVRNWSALVGLLPTVLRVGSGSGFAPGFAPIPLN